MRRKRESILEKLLILWQSTWTCLHSKESSVENILIFINCSTGFQYKGNQKGEREISDSRYIPVHHLPICMKIGGIPYATIVYILACNSKVHWKFLFALVFSEISSSLPWKCFCVLISQYRKVHMETWDISYFAHKSLSNQQLETHRVQHLN